MSVATRMTVPYSYLNRQYPPVEIEAYLEDIRALALTGDFTLGYPVREFEDTFSRMVGAEHVVGANSGTAALVLILRALGIGHGDEVIVPVNTFVATAGAVAMVGAKPVFCDVQGDFTIDPEAAQAAITSKTRAIMAVHLTGTMADVPALPRHLVYVIEDAAQAFGATLDGQMAGHYGAAVAWSMHPLKMVNVWGDAGAVSTGNGDIDRKMRLLRNHGLETRDDVVMFGDNLRISSLQAAIACRALRTAEQSAQKRRENALMLTQMLAPLSPAVQTPIVRTGVNPVYATYMIRAERRDALRDYLVERGIDVKVHYPRALHMQTVGQRMGYREGQFPVAERHAKTILSLPMHEYLKSEEIEYVAECVADFYRGVGT